jgi:hypothetical protein
MRPADEQGWRTSVKTVRLLQRAIFPLLEDFWLLFVIEVKNIACPCLATW